MGINLVRLALLYHAPHIGGRAFKVLAYMASTALDQPNAKGQPERLYFAGWENLARVIGQDPERGRPAYEQVRRVLLELEAAGLIERLEEHPSTGRRQGFRLLVGPRAAPETEGHMHPKERGSRHRIGGAGAPETEGPRTDAGLIEDLSQDDTPSSTYSSTARARSARAMDAHEYEDDHTEHHDCAICTLPRRHPDHSTSGAA